MIVVSDTITLTAITIRKKIIWTNVQNISSNTAIFGLMTEAGIWKKYILHQYGTRSRHSQLIHFVQYQSQTIGILKLIENIPLAEFKNRKSAKLDRISWSRISWPRHRNSSRLDRKISSKWSFLLWLEAIDTQKKAVLFMKKWTSKFVAPSNWSLN
jgi:hypothetical protein